ncbi:uncharacterized protein LOC111712513, partial [Eurytemora carolleeae]|uniref:uncharacterized protein LOC111712513 n=1 Tax=Eurytemora carolleeae TaxID=1294199 RepID=UPI000C76DB9D
MLRLVFSNPAYIGSSEDETSCGDLLNEPITRTAILESADVRTNDVRTADVRTANVKTADVRTADVTTADVRTADVGSVDAQKEATVECAAIVEEFKGTVNIPLEMNPVGESDGTSVLASVEVHKTHVDKDRPEADEVDEEGVDQVDGPSSLLVWNGQEWTSRSMIEGSPKNERSYTSYAKSVSYEGSRTEPTLGEIRIIDIPMEENPSILINSILGIFYPVYFINLNPSLPKYSSLPRELLNKQLTTIRSLVVVYNLILLIIIFTIFILVMFSSFFNYYTNILDNFWFIMATLFLGWMGLMSLVWTVNPYPTLKQTSGRILGGHTEPDPRVLKPQEQENTNIQGNLPPGVRKRVNDHLGPEHIAFNIMYCTLATIIIILPTIIGLTLFKLVPVQETTIFTIQENTGLRTLKSLRVKSAVNMPLYTVKGLVGNCTALSENMLFIHEKMVCRLEDDIVAVHIDSTPEAQWRVSSPYYITSFSGLPTLSIRKVDWDQLISKPNQTFYTSADPVTSELLETLIPCRNIRNLDLGILPENSCQEKTYLSPDGQIFERNCLKHQCFKNGLPCEDSAEEFKLNLPCSDVYLEDSPILVADSGEELKQAEFTVGDRRGSSSRFCCRNTTNIIEIFGSNCPKSAAELMQEIR